MPVIIPPVRKLMRFGARWEKSLDGLTTLAPMFRLSVAIRMLMSARKATKG